MSWRIVELFAQFTVLLFLCFVLILAVFFFLKCAKELIENWNRPL